jgi:hypothetical protein
VDPAQATQIKAGLATVKSGVDLVAQVLASAASDGVDERDSFKFNFQSPYFSQPVPVTAEAALTGTGGIFAETRLAVSVPGLAVSAAPMAIPAAGEDPAAALLAQVREVQASLRVMERYVNGESDMTAEDVQAAQECVVPFFTSCARKAIQQQVADVFRARKEEMRAYAQANAPTVAGAYIGDTLSDRLGAMLDAYIDEHAVQPLSAMNPLFALMSGLLATMLSLV